VGQPMARASRSYCCPARHRRSGRGRLVEAGRERLPAEVSRHRHRAQGSSGGVVVGGREVAGRLRGCRISRVLRADEDAGRSEYAITPAMVVDPRRTVKVAALIVAGSMALLKVTPICSLTDTFVAAFDGPAAMTVGGAPVLELPPPPWGRLIRSCHRDRTRPAGPRQAKGIDVNRSSVAVWSSLIACCLP
jgi:hypothetical protein